MKTIDETRHLRSIEYFLRKDCSFSFPTSENTAIRVFNELKKCFVVIYPEIGVYESFKHLLYCFSLRKSDNKFSLELCINSFSRLYKIDLGFLLSR